MIHLIPEEILASSSRSGIVPFLSIIPSLLFKLSTGLRNKKTEIGSSLHTRRYKYIYKFGTLSFLISREKEREREGRKSGRGAVYAMTRNADWEGTKLAVFAKLERGNLGLEVSNTTFFPATSNLNPWKERMSLSLPRGGRGRKGEGWVG